MIQRIMALYSPSPSSTVGSLTEAQFGAVELGDTDGRDLGAGRRPFRQERLVPVDPIDDDGLTGERHRFAADVGPGLARRRVQHGRVRDDLPAAVRRYCRGLDVQPL